MNSAMQVGVASRLKLAELTSSLGAGVLGAGIGILLAGYLGGLGLPVLVLGLVLHAWGMRDKHALEAGAPQVWWSTALYWICWVALAGLVVYAVARAMGAL
jgi:hypothetical protein